MTTQSFALFGYPLGHTVSPFIHNELFKLNNISAEYSAIELPPDDITEAPQFIKEKLNGCNLTIPHKSSVIPLLDKLESRAELYGAVNTVNNKNGVLTGYNTDCVGFLRAINHAGIELKGRVLVCGAGGASRMMAFESAMADCRVTVAVRAGGKDKGEKLASEIKEKLGKDITVSLYDDLTADFDIVLNGTPVGMYPKTNACPVTEEIIKNSESVFDAVYNPHKTQLLKIAEKYGKKCGYGIVMLVWQAAAAQEIWFNTKFSSDNINKTIALANEEVNKKFMPATTDNPPVVLCGFMGCGKSTVGKILAEKLSFDFIDADNYIEQKANKKIADIFKEDGEEFFRNLEHEACKELAGKKNTVIATGGGALTFERNVKAFKNCRVVLLNVKTEILLDRLKRDSQPRPVFERALKDGTVQTLINERMKAYLKAADIKADILTEQPPEITADLIKANYLKKF